MNTITIELANVLRSALPLLHTGDEIPMEYYITRPGILGDALRALAKYDALSVSGDIDHDN
jgi:hypothetical protein